MMTEYNISAKLSELRATKGVTQDEVANALSISNKTVSKWEKGLSVPDADLLIRLADTLDTSVSTLLGGTAEPEETPEIQQLSEKLARLNEELAQNLKELICKTWEHARVEIMSTRGLCSFYAEKGGLIVAY